MTITIVTPPGDIASDAPLIFTATEPITSVMVELTPLLGSPTREGVYDGVDADLENGTFAELYTESTRVGDTWTIRRTGGWPCHAQLRITPGSEAPTTLWTELYSADLRTFASQPIIVSSNDGLDLTLDDQPYWASASGNAAAPISLVNGQGVKMVGSQAAAPGNNYAGTYFGLRIHQMPGYDPAKLTAFLCRFAQANGAAEIGATVGSRIHTGGAGYSAPATGAAHVQINPTSIAYWSSSHTMNIAIPNNFGWALDEPAVCVGMLTGPYELSPAYPNGRWRRHRQGLFLPEVGSGLPPVEAMQVFGATNYTGTGEGANFRGCAYCSASNASPRTRYVTHVGVFQKAVPAL